MIRRALLSVSDKTGIVALARALAARNVEVLSTGGTLKALRAEGVAAVGIEDFTGSPEVMGGRVKTLHPRVHGGLLAREGTDDADLERIGGKPIDLVVVNLYPFGQTVAKPEASHQDIIENIDIGGPSMLRSAAKNHDRVTVICDPADYEVVLAEIEAASETSEATRARLAAKVFGHTAAYDGAIAAYLSGPRARGATDGEAAAELPGYLTLAYERVATLRYGENPHQRAGWYRERQGTEGTISGAESVGAGGKELSFNNLVDLDAALEAVREYDEPAAAVIKHTNPCGLAVAAKLSEAYKLAREGDPMSAFGGIVALNRPVDLETAQVIAETFIEGIIAPGFDDDALARLRKKKALRLVQTGPWAVLQGLTYKRIGGGLVVQGVDATGRGEVAEAQVVTERAPTEQELASLAFGWTVCKHVKSNAIVLANGTQRQVVGVGAGQMSRVDSVEIACRKAGERAQGAVLASDAFFPFPDGVQAAIDAGVTAVAQPGGSKGDDKVIAAANAGGIAMVMTGKRHFRH